MCVLLHVVMYTFLWDKLGVGKMEGDTLITLLRFKITEKCTLQD